jgi:hypothetical protein
MIQLNYIIKLKYLPKSSKISSTTIDIFYGNICEKGSNLSTLNLMDLLKNKITNVILCFLSDDWIDNHLKQNRY